MALAELEPPAQPDALGVEHLAVGMRAPAPFHPSLEPDAVCLGVDAALSRCGLEPSARAEHRYTPQGLSYSVFGPHLTLVLHTWPELGLATVDVVLRGGPGADVLLERLTQALGWQLAEVHALRAR